MHQTRKEASLKLPIPRKGTKYLARALSHPKDSVPVVLALRDMLKLAKTSAEVKSMIHRKLIKLNGRLVSESNEGIKLFNLFEADKNYVLTLSPTGKFVFEESKESKVTLCKVIGKSLVNGGDIQLSLHDGSTVISKEKVSVGDSVYIDNSGKLNKVKLLEKGAHVLVISGKYSGQSGKADSVSNGKVSVSLKGGSAELDKSAVVAI